MAAANPLRISNYKLVTGNTVLREQSSNFTVGSHVIFFAGRNLPRFRPPNYVNAYNAEKLPRFSKESFEM